MSRVPKWKVEKTKVKVVFRLQFHATHIPPGWDKLFLSLIPCDTGKATAKTTKTNVRNGNCKWSDPIYETTRLLLDTRTKKYDEKLYKLVIATGSSRSSLLGEVNINLADFADASKPSSFQLPLQSCDFGTILHATVQLLTSKTGFREFEQQREASVKGFQTTSVQRSPDPVANLVESSDTTNEQIDKGRFIHKSALEQDALLKDDEKHIIDIKAHQEEQKKLRMGMDLLLKELERLKNENLSSLFPLEESDFNPSLQGLQRELTQLDMANEHLRSIFPSFKELTVNGNALERVLALELELAESLQSKKKKPDDRFQSSFLKQHSDEEAVYQSFRDINDLIKDMLELKKRKMIVETELKEMHDRYSQLSLQFAEVEGERQKLVMTLKNRTPRKSQSFPGREMSSIFEK